MTHPEQPKDYEVIDDIYLTKNQKFGVLVVAMLIAGGCFLGGYLGAASIKADGDIEQAKLLAQWYAKEWMMQFGGPRR